MAQDIYPGPIDSSPWALSNVDGTLYLSADEGLHGMEPWIMPMEQSTLRGDTNADGQQNISDAIRILGCLFLGEECPATDCVLDVNDDAEFNISDAISLLAYLFLGGEELRECP
jgi:hypothetical protein